MMKRRAILAGFLTCVALSPLAAAADSSTINPWAPRKLKGWEAGKLQDFQTKLSSQFPEIRDAVKDMGDHIRLRLQEDDLFTYGTAELHPDGVRLLTLIAERMKDSDIRAEAVAHHHFDGDSYRSFIISERRANAVIAALMSRQIEPHRLLSTGMGENFPITSNATEEGRKQNRRVEMLFRLL